jgi:hypothetical protein
MYNHRKDLRFYCDNTNTISVGRFVQEELMAL